MPQPLINDVDRAHLREIAEGTARFVEDIDSARDRASQTLRRHLSGSGTLLVSVQRRVRSFMHHSRIALALRYLCAHHICRRCCSRSTNQPSCASGGHRRNPFCVRGSQAPFSCRWPPSVGSSKSIGYFIYTIY